MALNALEAAVYSAPQGEGRRVITLPMAEEAMQRKALLYDRAGEEHYNIISAFHKSLRGSDPDAALYWLARMLEAGEDPLYVARRMVRFASEDVGLADPQALSVRPNVHGSFPFYRSSRGGAGPGGSGGLFGYGPEEQRDLCRLMKRRNRMFGKRELCRFLCTSGMRPRS